MGLGLGGMKGGGREHRAQAVAIPLERDPGQSARGDGDQQFSQRRGQDRPLDRHPFAAAPPLTRRHAQALLAVGVEAAGPGIARFVQRAGHAFLGGQRFGRPDAAQRTGIGGGRHPGRPLEQPVEMVGGIADPLRQRGERGHRLGGFENHDGLRHRLAITGHRIGQAAQAGAIARRPCRIGLSMNRTCSRRGRRAAQLGRQ